MNNMEHDFIEGTAGNCKNCKNCKCHPLHTAVIILLLGILATVIYVAYMLPKIVRSEVQREPALKAGGVSNYERILNEVYNTPEYQKMMTQQLEQALTQNKAMMEMYSQQQNSGDVLEEPTQEDGAALSGAEALSGETPTVVDTGVAK